MLPRPLPGEQLAKPSRNVVTLRDHRQHVFDEAKGALAAFPGVVSTHDRMTSGDLRTSLLTAAWLHDLGKEHPDWQRACRLDREQGGGRNLMRSGLRHEFASLGYALEQTPDLSLAVRVAIAAHHGKLSHRFEHRWQHDADGAFVDTWGRFLAESREPDARDRGDARWRRRLMQRYTLAGARSLLRLADVRASRAEQGKWNPALAALAFEIKDPFPDLKHVQAKALDLAEANAPVSVLRAPTGSGKTYASLLWAEHHVRAGRADRLVIAMPTRFTSNALAVDLSAKLGDTGLYHSSAWNIRYGDVERNSPDGDRAAQIHRLAFLLATPATVCTVDHLLMALTGAREDHHAILFFLASAAVVVDEADFYDPFVQANLQVLLRALRVLEVPVLVMSATVPDAAAPFYGSTERVAQADQEREPLRSIAYLGEAEGAADVADVLGEMIAGEAGIVYCNTVARALNVYRWLSDKANNPDDVPVFLYHSRFTEPDKKDREQDLTDAVGRDAWKQGSARGIAVLTQIGEMSVNVSAPLMLSDLCPWDRLAQRAGRLNRFGEADTAGGGRLVVVTPTKDGAFYPAPYGSWSNGWMPGAAIAATRTDIEAGFGTDSTPVTAADFSEAVNRLYPDPTVFDTSAESNRDELRRMMQDHWMIQPGTPRKPDPADEDSAQVGDAWRARDIPPQVVVLTDPPDERLSAQGVDEANLFVFESYASLRQAVDAVGVSVPKGLAEREIKSGRGRLVAFPFAIGTDSVRRDEIDGIAYLVAPRSTADGASFYEPAVGLAWLGEKNDLTVPGSDEDW